MTALVTGAEQVEKQQLPRVEVAEVEVALGADATIPKSFASSAEERKALHLKVSCSTTANHIHRLESLPL